MSKTLEVEGLKNVLSLQNKLHANAHKHMLEHTLQARENRYHWFQI